MTISMEEARKIIGGKDECSDEELQRIIYELQSLTELVYDKWVEEQGIKL